MKGPVECVPAEGEVDRSAEFEEYMWMAEEDLEDFDKKVLRSTYMALDFFFINNIC